MNTILYQFGVEAIRRKFARRADTSNVKVYGNKKVNGSSFFGGQLLSQTVADGKGGVVTIEKPIAFIRMGRATRAFSTVAQIQQHTWFALGNKWANAALIDLSAVGPNQNIFKEMVADPKLHITVGDKTLYAAGYNMRGLIKAYGIYYAMTNGGIPSSHVLPTPESDS